MNNGYSYTRAWFDFAFEHPDQVTASHGILYLWLVEINNRLGWVDIFQITASECMQGMGCKSYNTYKKCFDDLVQWQFVKIVKKAVNQHQCNIVALSKFDKALNKSLDKALMKHLTKQSESTVQSNCDIHKQVNKETKKQRNNIVSDKPPLESSDGLLFTQCMASYDKFYKKHTGVPPKIDAIDGKALKSMISYFTGTVNARPEKPENVAAEIVKCFDYLFHNVKLWQPFHQGRLKLSQINSDLPNIISSIKNGNKPINKNGNKPDPSDVLAEFARRNNIDLTMPIGSTQEQQRPDDIADARIVD